MKLSDYISPVRGKDESYEAFRIRRCSANYHVADMLKGKLVWNSSLKKTYVKLA
jgi:hypothetical protein